MPAPRRPGPPLSPPRGVKGCPLTQPAARSGGGRSEAPAAAQWACPPPRLRAGEDGACPERWSGAWSEASPGGPQPPHPTFLALSALRVVSPSAGKNTVGEQLSRRQGLGVQAGVWGRAGWARARPPGPQRATGTECRAPRALGTPGLWLPLPWRSPSPFPSPHFSAPDQPSHRPKAAPDSTLESQARDRVRGWCAEVEGRCAPPPPPWQAAGACRDLRPASPAVAWARPGEPEPGLGRPARCCSWPGVWTSLGMESGRPENLAPDPYV